MEGTAEQDPPSRLGEILDTIVAKAGIKRRMIPGSLVLNKGEALALLSFIDALESCVRSMGGINGDERSRGV